MEEEAQKIIFDFKFELNAKYSNDPIINAYNANYNSKHYNLIVPKIDPFYNFSSYNTESAAICLDFAIREFKPDIVINIGTCGGIQKNLPGIKVGDCYAIKKAICFERTVIIPPAGPYAKSEYPILDPSKFEQILGIKAAVVGTSNSFLTEHDNAKQQGIQIVEMEAAAFNRVAYLHKVPFQAFKFVSDVDEQSEGEIVESFESFFVKRAIVMSNTLKKFLDSLNQF